MSAGENTKLRALVADDDRATAVVLRSILQARGIDVVVARDGNAAWSLLKADPTITLSVFDWMMPGVDGPELCRRVRKDEARSAMYVLLTTARDKTEDLVAGLEAGADDYLVKPINIDGLRARIDVVLL